MSQLVRNTLGMMTSMAVLGHSFLCRQSILRSISRHRVDGSDRDGRRARRDASGERLHGRRESGDSSRRQHHDGHRRKDFRQGR